jgi:hypothetical protein
MAARSKRGQGSGQQQRNEQYERKHDVTRHRCDRSLRPLTRTRTLSLIYNTYISRRSGRQTNAGLSHSKEQADCVAEAGAAPAEG